MSSGPARRVSPKDIQTVQNLIERCLQLYMNRREVVETLLAQAKIEPGFTELVWQKLEEENQDFFKAYNLRLMVKSQIMQFNKLLEQQVQLMHQMNSPIPVPSSNGNHIASLHRNPPRYGPETMVGTVGTRLYSNNGNDPSVHNLSGSVDMSVHSNRNNVPAEMITSQSSNMCMMRSGMVKSETEYSGTSPFLLPGNGSVLEPRVDGSVQSFSSVDSCAHVLNDALLDTEIAFAQLSQFPRNFSLSDLTADFAQSSDILESYSGSPFLLNDNETFMDSRGRENQGEAKRLDTISEGMNYDDFGSE